MMLMTLVMNQGPEPALDETLLDFTNMISTHWENSQRARTSPFPGQWESWGQHWQPVAELLTTLFEPGTKSLFMRKAAKRGKDVSERTPYSRTPWLCAISVQLKAVFVKRFSLFFISWHTLKTPAYFYPQFGEYKLGTLFLDTKRKLS